MSVPPNIKNMMLFKRDVDGTMLEYRRTIDTDCPGYSREESTGRRYKLVDVIDGSAIEADPSVLVEAGHTLDYKILIDHQTMSFCRYVEVKS